MTKRAQNSGSPKADMRAKSEAGGVKRPASRRPPRSISIWLLGTFVMIAGGGGWLGMEFGDRIVGMVQSLLASGTPSGEMEGVGLDQDGQTDEDLAEFYTCGMHPWVVLPEPGDCPICHMELTPIDPAKFTGEVSIDPVVVQNIGVRIEAVSEGPLTRSLRTVGTVEYDETRVRDVNTKYSGWIEELHVDYVGASVERGDPLFSVYSPELYQAQEEYLLALRTQREVAGDEGPQRGGRRVPFDLVGSARTKLELFDVTPEQIERLGEAGEASRAIEILSPHTGVVIAKHANEGMRIDPGMQVFRIADFSRVWVMVTLYESQLPYVSEGQSAVMTLPYIPGVEFHGRVDYVYPYVGTQTREVQVRLEFENKSGLLKPGMFATVELQSTLRSMAVLAPRAAVISTGDRDIAFVSLGEGRFEPRNVRLGVETGDGSVEVLDGLIPGEMVVTSGQFLLDSESRVREALAKMVRGNLASDQQGEAEVVGASEVSELPEAVGTELSSAIGAYFALGEMLSSDSVDNLDTAARELAGALERATAVPIPQDEHFWHQHSEAGLAHGAALELIGERDITVAREHFANLSVAMDKLLRATGIPASLGMEVQALHCPMYREGQGGSTWLQKAGSVRNPFFGSMMLECFDRREALAVTGAGTPEKKEFP